MAFRAEAGMAAIAGLQNYHDLSKQVDYTAGCSALGPSSGVEVLGGRSTAARHDDTDNEDLDGENSDGEFSDSEYSGSGSWDGQQLLPQGRFSRELYAIVARHSNILSNIPGYCGPQWPVHGQPFNLSSQSWQGLGLQTTQSSPILHSQWGQPPDSIEYQLGSQPFPILESQSGQSPASIEYQLGSESSGIPKAQVVQSPVSLEYQLGSQSFDIPRPQEVVSPDIIDYQLGSRFFRIPQPQQGKSAESAEYQLGLQFFPISQSLGVQSLDRFENRPGSQAFPIPHLAQYQSPDRTEYHLGSKVSPQGDLFPSSLEYQIVYPSVCSTSQHNLLPQKAQFQTSKPSTSSRYSSSSQPGRDPRTWAGRYAFDYDRRFSHIYEGPGKWTTPLSSADKNEPTLVSCQPIDNRFLQMNESYSTQERQLPKPLQIFSWQQRQPSQASRQSTSESSHFLQQRHTPRNLKLQARYTHNSRPTDQWRRVSQPEIRQSFPYPLHWNRSFHSQLHPLQSPALKEQELLPANMNAEVISRSPYFLHDGSVSGRYPLTSLQPSQNQILPQTSALMLVPVSQPLRPDLQSQVSGHVQAAPQLKSCGSVSNVSPPRFQSLGSPSPLSALPEFQCLGPSSLSAPFQFWSCGPSSTSGQFLSLGPSSMSAISQSGSFRRSPTFAPLQFSSLGPSPTSFAPIHFSSLGPSPANGPHQWQSTGLSPMPASLQFQSLGSAPLSASCQFRSCCQSSPMFVSPHFQSLCPSVFAFPQFGPLGHSVHDSLQQNLLFGSCSANLQPLSQSSCQASATSSCQVQSSFEASPIGSTAEVLSYQPPRQCEPQYSGQQSMKRQRPSLLP